MARLSAFAAVLLAVFAAATFASPPASAAAPAVLLNEVLYDPPGTDTGGEFVEIMNAGEAPVSLQGWRLESGNGAGPDRWTLEWEGPADLVLAPGALFVLGEDAVAPAPDTILPLDLQNGPDGCRIVSPEGDVDVLGWGGGLVHPEYFEGAPCPEPPAGASLGRRTDGADSDRNDQDFVPLDPPTPGAPNRSASDVGLLPPVEWSPRWGEPGAPIEVVLGVVNAGSEMVGAGEVAVVLEREAEEIGRADLEEPLAPDEEADVAVTWLAPPEGLHRVRARVALAGDGSAGNDTLSASVRSGVGPLVVAEILYLPASGEPEWIEVLHRGAAPFDLAGCTLEDGSGSRRLLVEESFSVSPGERVLLAADPEGLVAARAVPADVVLLRPAGGWPALNNTDAADGGPADLVVLREAGGVPLDSVAYRSAWGAAPGQSLERRDAGAWGWLAASWAPSADSTGATPGRPPSVAAAGGSAAGAAWEIGDVDATGRVRMAFRFPPSVSEATLDVYTVGGRRVATPFQGAVGEGESEIAWAARRADGSPLPGGPYVLSLVGYGAGGEPLRRLRRVWVLGPRP